MPMLNEQQAPLIVLFELINPVGEGV